MTNLEKTILIDRYLLGEMTEEEKVSFERLLSDTDSSYTDKVSLKDEMNLQQEIILAIQERGLREMLQREEAKIREEEDADIAAATSISWPKHIVRAVSSVAVAACFCGIFIAPQVSRLASISNDAELYAAVSMDMNEAYVELRGCEENADIILRANELMQQGLYKQADALLASSLKELSAAAPTSQAWTEKEDMLYLRALCAIKQHKLYRSRMLLNEVINMNSTHQAVAQQLLNQIKGRK